MKRTTRFRELLRSPRLEFLLEAHNGLSARICEEAGFQGIWASGLCLSAQYGVRDNNEASWTQILEMLEFMADATTVPILLDGDTGYGNFNNVRRLVRKLEQRGIAAVCLEDKLFPKKNSFLDGPQPLAEIDEYCGKVKAGKDVQSDEDFCIVARTEALIAGHGLAEALRRCEAYVEAGADGVLIHSKRSTPDEVLAFQREWAGRAPVVIVPTKYSATPTEVFRQAGFSIAIWANHLLRSAISAMQESARAIARDQGLGSVEDRIATVDEIFRLQGDQELREAERRFLPRAQGARAIVLAASQGAELGELTDRRPKAMVPVRGKPLLEHIVGAYRAAGVHDVIVVRGFAKEAIDLEGIAYVDNDDYADTGELHSLRLALEAIEPRQSPLLVSYGDVLFRRSIPRALLESEADLVVAVDSSWQESANRDRSADWVRCSAPATAWEPDEPVLLRSVSTALPPEQRHGEWMGFLAIRPRALARVRQELERLLAAPGQRRAGLPALLEALVQGGERVHVLYTSGNWLDVDRLADVVEAGSF